MPMLFNGLGEPQPGVASEGAVAILKGHAAALRARLLPIANSSSARQRRSLGKGARRGCAEGGAAMRSLGHQGKGRADGIAIPAAAPMPAR
jgi:hypothetical protein